MVEPFEELLHAPRWYSQLERLAGPDGCNPRFPISVKLNWGIISLKIDKWKDRQALGHKLRRIKMEG